MDRNMPEKNFSFEVIPNFVASDSEKKVGVKLDLKKEKGLTKDNFGTNEKSDVLEKEDSKFTYSNGNFVLPELLIKDEAVESQSGLDGNGPLIDSVTSNNNNKNDTSNEAIRFSSSTDTGNARGNQIETFCESVDLSRVPSEFRQMKRCLVVLKRCDNVLSSDLRSSEGVADYLKSRFRSSKVVVKEELNEKNVDIIGRKFKSEKEDSLIINSTGNIEYPELLIKQEEEESQAEPYEDDNLHETCAQQNFLDSLNSCDLTVQCNNPSNSENARRNQIEIFYGSTKLNVVPSQLSRLKKCFVLLKPCNVNGNSNNSMDRNKVTCPLCGVTCKSKIDLITHAERIHYTCKLCKKVFLLHAQLQCHVAEIHSKDARYKCSHCERTFKRSNDLYRVSTDSGVNILICSKCDDSLTRSKQLSSVVRRFKCPDCDKSFKDSLSLTRHVLGHLGIKPYKCLECDKSFTRSEHLSRHMLVHTGEKPFECTECQKSFSQSSTLEQHKRTHTGEKPFKCEHCGKLFRYASSLTPHVRIHTGAKPFKCPLCDESFMFHANLKLHRLMHSGERPFKCLECEKTFLRSSNLKAHIIVHARNKIKNS